MENQKKPFEAPSVQDEGSLTDVTLQLSGCGIDEPGCP